MHEMLDNPCKTPCSDGPRLPRLENGVLTASCECGQTLSVELGRISHSAPCPGCGLPAAEGIVNGPHRPGILRLTPPHERTDGDNVVYFALRDGLIKIGTSHGVHKRVQTLGRAQLLGCHPGGFAEERRVHELFADSRVEGEWFADSFELRTYIAEHCTIPERPAPSPGPPRMPVSWGTIARHQL